MFVPSFSPRTLQKIMQLAKAPFPIKRQNKRFELALEAAGSTQGRLERAHFKMQGDHSNGKGQINEALAALLATAERASERALAIGHEIVSLEAEKQSLMNKAEASEDDTAQASSLQSTSSRA